jgi:hypothetical protein
MIEALRNALEQIHDVLGDGRAVNHGSAMITRVVHSLGN